MVHGFDNAGKAYDKDGFKLNWWTKKEEKDYANRTRCLVSCFQEEISVVFKEP